jgi:hypothetical protein
MMIVFIPEALYTPSDIGKLMPTAAGAMEEALAQGRLKALTLPDGSKLVFGSMVLDWLDREYGKRDA